MKKTLFIVPTGVEFEPTFPLKLKKSGSILERLYSVESSEDAVHAIAIETSMLPLLVALQDIVDWHMIAVLAVPDSDYSHAWRVNASVFSTTPYSALASAFYTAKEEASESGAKGEVPDYGRITESLLRSIDPTDDAEPAEDE